MPSPPSRQVPPRRGAIAGVAGVAVALGIVELAAGLLVGVPSAVVAVGSAVIELAPPGAKRVAIALFGLADKLALNTGTVVLTVVVAAGLGAVTTRRRWVASVGFLVLGVVGMLAAADRPYVAVPVVIVTYSIALGVGLFALRRLLLTARGPAADRLDDGDGVATRRRFLAAAGGTLIGSVVLALIGRVFVERGRATTGASVALPPPDRAVPPPPPAASFDVRGLTPIVVPNEDFYRIDTALIVPRVDVDGWRLRVTGMVDREVELGYDDLLAMTLVERYVTIACVSNEIGGGLVGNASWLGVPLDEILDRAGVQAGASQIVGRSVDGWTAGFPTEAAFDGRGALVAVGMNGEPLPPTHGFPARLIVPGLYGYVSATKWLDEIQLTTWDAFDAYWVPRGWAKEGPVHSQSRIDVPRRRVDAGPTTVAGVAWAPDRGIAAVEVRIDGGEWREAELTAPLSDAAWRQWRLRWNATPGRHTLEVRATDGEGEVQTAEVTDPFPDGATGYHTVQVTVV